MLSDTHIPERAKDLPAEIYEDLKDADLLLHAGDVASKDFLVKLQKITDVKAVCGNMDDYELRKELPKKRIISVGKFSIGLIHGWGAPQDLVSLVEKEFFHEKPNIIIFGHTHKPLNLRRNDTLLFNPGSPTDRVFTDINTYGIITIDTRLKAEIINISGHE